MGWRSDDYEPPITRGDVLSLVVGVVVVAVVLLVASRAIDVALRLLHRA